MNKYIDLKTWSIPLSIHFEPKYYHEAHYPERFPPRNERDYSVSPYLHISILCFYFDFGGIMKAEE